MQKIGVSEPCHQCPNQTSSESDGELDGMLHAATHQNEITMLLQNMHAEQMQLFEARFAKFEDHIATMLNMHHQRSQGGPSPEAEQGKLHLRKCSSANDLDPTVLGKPGSIHVQQSPNLISSSQAGSSPPFFPHFEVDNHDESTMLGKPHSKQLQTIPAELEEVAERPSLPWQKSCDVLERIDGRMCQVLPQAIKKAPTVAQMVGTEGNYFWHLDRASARARMGELLQNVWSETVIQFVIVANSIYMAWETDSVARNLAEPKNIASRFVESFFTVFFCMDISLRLYVERRAFITGSNRRWNVLDSIVVSTALLEEAMEFVNSHSSTLSSTKVVRVIRVLRLVRILRFIRGASYFTELRALCLGIFRTLSSLLWALLLLVMVIFIFSIYLTQGVAYYLIEQMEDGAGDIKDHDLRASYGSLLLTMYSLWKAVTGGADWETFCDPLFEISALTGIIFVIFIAFVVCAVMNVVTGIFVDKALKATEGDLDLVMITHTKDRRDHIEAVRRVFEKADTDGSGCLTKAEFAEHFTNPSVHSFFESLGLEIDGIAPDKLFDLLDFDGDDMVTANEFIHGCCTMRGAARNLDLARLTHNFNKHEVELANHITYIGSSLTAGLKHHAKDLQTVKETLEELTANSRLGQAELRQARNASYRGLDWKCNSVGPIMHGDLNHVEDNPTPDDNEDELLTKASLTIEFQVFFGEEVQSLGFLVEWSKPTPVVGLVYENGEAEARGICTGDLIQLLNDHRTEGLSREELLPRFKIRPLTLQLSRVSQDNKGVEIL